MRILILMLAFAMTGCFTRYNQWDTLPSEYEERLDNLEEYYIAQARNKAAFESDCPIEEVTATVLATDTHGIFIDPDNLTVIYHGPLVESIGVSGCDSKVVYEILCFDDDTFEAPVLSRPGHSCKVVRADGGAREYIVEGADRVQSMNID